MLEDFLEIGMKIIIEVKRDSGDLFFSSKIEDLTSEEIILGMPMKGGRTFFIGNDEEINIYFSKKGSFYCLEGKVIEKQYEPLPIIKMIPINSPYKKQKRSYFRLKIALPITIKICDTEDTFIRYTRDISAGGIKFAHSNLIEVGTNLEVKIPDILGDKIVIKASVIRTEYDSTREVNKYDIALKFLDISDKIRDEIVKFILAKQRELRKNGVE